jgi:TolB-like protein
MILTRRYAMWTRLCLALVGAACFSLPLHAQQKFFDYYEAGTEYMEKGDWQRAISEFRSAASLEFEDAKRRRTYGTHFIEYFPHREMGIALYQLGDLNSARKELELSLAYLESERAEEYLGRVTGGVSPKVSEAERKYEAELALKQKSIASSKREPPPPEVLPAGALTYDPQRVTQVGSRLALAVLPFTMKGRLDPADGDVLAERMVTQLVNLRRFRVIERSALEKLLKEQQLQVSGVVDEATAVKVGKVAGADAIVLGSASVAGANARINTRVVDTETGEAIIAHGETVDGTETEALEAGVEKAAIGIYNELPIVEGYVVSIDQDMMYIDLGREKGVRKGTKCVAFREGEKILHPTSGEVLGKKVTKLGELLVVSVQDRLSQVRVLEKEADMKVGDKVVVK